MPSLMKVDGNVYFRWDNVNFYPEFSGYVSAIVDKSFAWRCDEAGMFMLGNSFELAESSVHKQSSRY